MTSETIITNRIKDFQTEYPEGVPINILKLDLDISVGELQEKLLTLEEQGVLFIENEEYVKLVENSPKDSIEEIPKETPFKSIEDYKKKSHINSAGESHQKTPEKALEKYAKYSASKTNRKPSAEFKEENISISTIKDPHESTGKNEVMYDLTDREIRALEIIKELADDSGHISRHILEGTLLYGELKLSTLGVYNLIMSLENKGIIRKIQIMGSEYYAL